MKSIDVIELAHRFADELKKANKGQKSSLPFIIHTLPDKPFVKPGEPFQVLVIGGSIYQNAICTVDEKHAITIYKRSNGEKPMFNTQYDFLGFVESMLDPDINLMAINFAFPLTPYFTDHKLDGRLVMAMKENAFDGMIGEPVGELVERYIKQKQKKDIRVTVANDTICELLSGIHQYDPDGLACGIVGTGINFAFFLDRTHPVNLESAHFDKFEQTETGKIVDARSNNPGASIYEKEISGAYLFQHFNVYAEMHDYPERVKSTKELDNFAQTCNGSNICTFTENLIDRAAAFAAVQIGGITLYKQRDMNFIMAGSLFWKAWQFKEDVMRYVQDIVPEYNVRCVQVENCEIAGAANLLV